MKRFVGFLMVFALTGGLIMAQHHETIAGKWNVSVQGEVAGGHHLTSVVLELEQDGTKIIGNFLIPEHGDLPLEGEFVNGKLTLHATEDAFMKLDLTAQLKENGQLAGTLASPMMGDYAWTAERAPSR